MFLKCAQYQTVSRKNVVVFPRKTFEQKINPKECEDSKWQIKIYDPYLIGIPWHSSLFCGRGRSCRRAIHSRSEGGANISTRLTRSRPDRQSIRDTFLDKSQSCSRRDTSTRLRWWSGLPIFPASIPEMSKSVLKELPARLLTSLSAVPVPAFQDGGSRIRLEKSKGGLCTSSRWTKRRESVRCRDLLWKAEKIEKMKKWISDFFVRYRRWRRTRGSFDKKFHTNWKIMQPTFCTLTTLANVFGIINCYAFFTSQKNGQFIFILKCELILRKTILGLTSYFYRCYLENLHLHLTRNKYNIWMQMLSNVFMNCTKVTEPVITKESNFFSIWEIFQ